MLKDRKPQIDDHVSTLMGVLESMDRGQTLTFVAMVKATGLTKDVPPWPTVVKKLKRRFENERGITLWPVPTVGYRLATAEEQVTELPTRRKRRASRQLSKGIGHLNAVPTEELSPFLQGVRSQKAAAYVRNRRQLIATTRVENELMRSKGSGLPPRS